jgi:hypothetical protein
MLTIGFHFQRVKATPCAPVTTTYLYNNNNNNNNNNSVVNSSQLCACLCTDSVATSTFICHGGWCYCLLTWPQKKRSSTSMILFSAFKHPVVRSLHTLCGVSCANKHFSSTHCYLCSYSQVASATAAAASTFNNHIAIIAACSQRTLPTAVAAVAPTAITTVAPHCGAGLYGYTTLLPDRLLPG